MAQETCVELRSGNNDAILGIYNKYHPFFLGYTRKRTHAFNDDRAISIIDDFWVELLNAKAICDFEGRSSLKTYLYKILNFRIIDNVRRANRQGAYRNNISNDGKEIDGFGDDGVSPESDLMDKERIRLIHETLLMMSEGSPADAFLVKLHLEGLSYQQMAERVLAKKSCSEKELKKKTDAIKKQFTRKQSGSLDKFKSCLQRVMRSNHLMQDDILN